MADAFIGEIRAFGFDFAPRFWTNCLGQLMPIAQFQALFAIVGNTYGGDGLYSFAVPMLSGRAPMHVGGVRNQGPGLSQYFLGDSFGFDSVQLAEQEIPAHRHTLHAGFTQGATSAQVVSNQSLLSITTQEQDSTSTAIFAYDRNGKPTAPLSSNSLDVAGISAPHENRQPYLALNFCMCLNGDFPPRSW